MSATSRPSGREKVRMNKIVILALAVALSGCESGGGYSGSSNSGDGGMSSDNAATLLMMLTAGMSGYNQGKALERASAPISTSCTTNGGITNCLSY
jgi:hypothetical protein